MSSSSPNASSRLPQNPIHGVRKISNDTIRLPRPLRGVPKILAFAVTSAHKNTARARAPGKLDITRAIAHDKRLPQVNRMILRCSLEHADFRFAALTAVCGTVRAIIYALEPGAFRSELLRHELVNRMYKGLGKISAANTGLIGYDENREFRIIQAADSFRCARQQSEPADVIQIADFFGDSAVAVEENGGPQRAGVRQGAPPAKKSTALQRLPRRRG